MGEKQEKAEPKEPTMADIMAELQLLREEREQTKKLLEAKEAALAAKDAELTAAKKDADKRLRAAAAARDGDKDEAVAELEAALAAKDAELEAAKASIPGTTEISAQRQVAQNNAQRNKLRALLIQRTHHKNGRAFYNTGDQPAYVGGHYIEANTTFAVAEDLVPSVLWKPVDHKGRVVGEEEESEFLDTSASSSTRAADRP